MGRIIQAELLKGKRSFGRKSLVIFPLLVSCMAIFLMGGQFTQIGAYNWWYMILLPMTVGLICTNLVDSDKRLSFFNVNVLASFCKQSLAGENLDRCTLLSIWQRFGLWFDYFIGSFVSRAISALAWNCCWSSIDDYMGMANSFRAVFGWSF